MASVIGSLSVQEGSTSYEERSEGARSTVEWEAELFQEYFQADYGDMDAALLENSLDLGAGDGIPEQDFRVGL